MICDVCNLDDQDDPDRSVPVRWQTPVPGEPSVLCDRCAWDVYEAERADRLNEWRHERGR